MERLGRLNIEGRSSARQTASTSALSRPTSVNRLLVQAFEWHSASGPSNGLRHWTRLAHTIPNLAALGVTALWVPPGCKANQPQGNGYDCYDLWDLGEFDQKGSRATKWGSRQELNELLDRANRHGVEIIWDTVLNHKTAGDATEVTWAVEVDPDDRRVEICQPKKIEAWLQYDFPGRAREGMKYSPLRWRAEHFNGTDWDQRAERNAIYKLIDDPATYPKPELSNVSLPQRSSLSLGRITRFANSLTKGGPPKAMISKRPGKDWADDVDKLHGNYDYLIFSNIYHKHPAVRGDLLQWCGWMLRDVGVHGFRIDAAQHFSSNFLREWISAAHSASYQRYGHGAFVVGEVLTGEVDRLLRWLDAVGDPSDLECGRHPHVYAFDFPLLFSFSRVSEDVVRGSRNADLRTLLPGPANEPKKIALVASRPAQAVTVVASHDTQLGQACATPMDAGLKALFYAFILLRIDGLPCVFWGDLVGTGGPEAEAPSCRVPISSPQMAFTQSKIGRSSTSHPNSSRPTSSRQKTGFMSTQAFVSISSTRPTSLHLSRPLLPSLMLARHFFAYGQQRDYFASASCIGWSRVGTHDRPGCVVVLSIADPGTWLQIKIAAGSSGERWVDILREETDGIGGRSESAVLISREGKGDFGVGGRAVAVYVSEVALHGTQTRWPVACDEVLKQFGP